MTGIWNTGEANTIMVRAEDFDLKSQTRGKQGYGEIRGIWQPVWLEARPKTHMQQGEIHHQARRQRAVRT